jgi:hypothetical protein
MSVQNNHPRADLGADEKCRPRLYTEKGDEEEVVDKILFFGWD